MHGKIARPAVISKIVFDRTRHKTTEAAGTGGLQFAVWAYGRKYTPTEEQRLLSALRAGAQFLAEYHGA